MKLNLDSLFNSLKEFKPDTLTSIVSFVRSHSDYNKITMMVRNSDKALNLLLKEYSILRENKEADVQLAGLLVIAGDSSGRGALWSADQCLDTKWSKAMRASYYIAKAIEQH